MALPVALIAAVATQILCQLYKVAHYSIRDRRLSFKYFFSAGGMPSAHSAFVTSLAVAVAIHSGVDSEVFAAVAVFGFIVMYDAYRLRGTVEKQSKIIKRLLAQRPDAAGGDTSVDDLPEMLGHTPQEIAVGVLVGAVLGAGFTLLLARL